MAWIVAIVIIMTISFFASSTVGKITLSAGTVAIGLLLLFLITGIEFFVTLAKVCAIIIVLASVAGLLIALLSQ